MTKIIKMETTLNRTSRFHMSDKTKAIIFEVITYLFIMLFVYTAYNKFITFDLFKGVLGRSVLIGQYSFILAWLIPSLEVILSVLLIIPKSKRIGLLGSLVLMILFTIYLIYMINSGSKLSCSCGGIVSALSWKQHIWFNIGFIILAAIGLKIHKK